ncbi:MAG TPA: hypothetical protein PKZ14_00530 [Chitinophagales bacterium]|nr:hypothetical protein [Chitinophagales bacterium]
MTKNEPDETEQLQIKKLPLISAINMVLTGEITDAMSMVALMKLKIWMDEGKFKI